LIPLSHRLAAAPTARHRPAEPTCQRLCHVAPARLTRIFHGWFGKVKRDAGDLSKNGTWTAAAWFWLARAHRPLSPRRLKAARPALRGLNRLAGSLPRLAPLDAASAGPPPARTPLVAGNHWPAAGTPAARSRPPMPPP